MLADLGRLSFLALHAEAVKDFPEPLRLPRTEALYVNCDGTTAPLDVIARTFPALSQLRLLGDADERIHDLTPLAALPRLRSVVDYGARFTGVENLAPTVEIKT